MMKKLPFILVQRKGVSYVPAYVQTRVGSLGLKVKSVGVKAISCQSSFTVTHELEIRTRK